MNQILVLVALVVGAACLVRLVEGLARRPDITAGLILLLQLIEVGVDKAYVPVPPISVSGASIYVADVAFGLVALAAFVRLLGIERLTVAHIGIIVAGGLAVFAVLRGATEMDIQQAANEFRGSFYFLSGTAYFMTVIGDRSMIARIQKLFLATAGLICCLVLVLWATTLSGGLAPKPFASPLFPGDSRVIGAGFTLILAQALLITLPELTHRFTRRGWMYYLPFLLFPVIVLLQHRTIWVALPFGLLVLGLRRPPSERGGIFKLLGFAAVTMVVIWLIMGGPESRLNRELEARTDTHTFEWRYEGWIELIEGPRAPQGTETLIGAPYGSGYEREVMEIEEFVAPHNYYVESYLRHGLLGVVALLFAYGVAITKLVRREEDRGTGGLKDPDVLLAIATLQLVFFVTYGPSLEQGILTGLILGTAALSPRKEAEAASHASYAGSRVGPIGPLPD